MMAKTRIAYLVTHPIQYQAPLLRRIAADPELSLTVFFGSDFSLRHFVDPGFGRAISWDVPLVEGYDHFVLPSRFRPLAQGEDPSFWRPFNRGISQVLRQGQFDALWVHGYHRAYHWVAMAAAERLGIKVLVRDEATAISAPRTPAKRLAKRLFFAGYDRLIDAYLAIGSLNRSYYQGLGVPAKKIFDVPYAVDNQFFQARIDQMRPEREVLRAKLGLKQDRPILLFAGKLIERKRPFELLDAYLGLADEPSARQPYLLYAGDGPLRPALEARIAASGADRVRILGFQSQGALAGLYDLADAFILCSEREAWGLVVNEAMNAGRAVIVNDRIGAGPDLVRSGENGFIYPAGDVASLTVCLRALLRDPDRLAAMGQRSRQIIDRWSFEEDIMGVKQALAFVRRVRS